jgi:hypothetical protein
MTTQKQPTRKVGAIFQFDLQSDMNRSHYRLLERVAPSTWKVEVIDGPDQGHQMTMRFVSRKTWDRYF